MLRSLPLAVLAAVAPFSIAVQVPEFEFDSAKNMAMYHAGVYPQSWDEIGQGEVKEAHGHTDMNATPKITIDTTKLADTFGTTDPDALMFLSASMIAHELMHYAGYGHESGDGPWWKQDATQSNCEHVAIYVNDLRITCDLAAMAMQDPNFADTLALLCEMMAGDLAELESGDFSDMLAACRSAQSAVPPTYVPPADAPELTLPDELPALCEACQ